MQIEHHDRHGHVRPRRTMPWVLGFVGIVLAGLLAYVGLARVPATGAEVIDVTDIGLASGFQDTFGGYHKRGRALIAADFDLDGRVDFFSGNPGDESFVMRNVPDGGPFFHFEVVQVLLDGPLAWGGVTLDYDNDGDYDLFISGGGNEGVDFDYLFRNNWIESGATELSFTDVTATAGVAGPRVLGNPQPYAVGSANAVAVDVNRDGWTDIFVNVRREPGPPNNLLGRNILWRNNGNGTFTDVTHWVGLGGTQRNTQHSTWLDIDNDGDYDFYEVNFENDQNNPEGYNVLWRNMLEETGQVFFQDVTDEFSTGNSDLRFPVQAFASASADFNNDGFHDLLILMKGPADEPGSPYNNQGNLLLINRNGTGFFNVTNMSGLNDPYIARRGSMGCQVGDINLDGVPDVYVGTGTMISGNYDQMYLSQAIGNELYRYYNASEDISFPAPEQVGLGYPPFPYRTHGVTIVDVDNDGTMEVGVSNGGPAASPDQVREPNRLFKFNTAVPANFFKVQAIGDGVNVSRDAIGTRFVLTVSTDGGPQREIHQTLFGGSCFSAHNGFVITFGLGQADTIHSLRVDWTDGTQTLLTSGMSANSIITVQR